MIEVELPGAHGLFSSRAGGVSRGPYASLNLGDHVGDDPADVAENRRLLAARVGVGWSAFRWARQVHGTRVAHGDATEADAQVAAIGAPATVFVADCVPVLLAGPGGVAAAHAGWRGLADGVLEAAAAAVGATHAVLGPSARGCCYEVGEEVLSLFAPTARRGRNLDLAEAARTRLDGLHVEDAGRCTICSDDFFSHRRDGGLTGRQAGVIWPA